MGEGSFLVFLTFKESLEQGQEPQRKEPPLCLHGGKREQGHELTINELGFSFFKLFVSAA